jgi:hypothetical protein
MNCSQAKSLFSPYLDGAITGMQMRVLSQHLGGCAHCQQEYGLLRQTQQLLGKAGRRRPSSDLDLRLRLAISREIGRSRQPFFQSAWLRTQNLVNTFMVPATAGLVTAVTVFGFLMGSMAMPLQANSGDVPLMKTAPEFQRSAFGMNTDSIQDDSLVIEAYINSQGRVDDYKVLSDLGTKDLPTQVKNVLIFTTFRPATYMGRPTSGHAVISFSKIRVRG